MLSDSWWICCYFITREHFFTWLILLGPIKMGLKYVNLDSVHVSIFKNKIITLFIIHLPYLVGFVVWCRRPSSSTVITLVHVCWWSSVQNPKWKASVTIMGLYAKQHAGPSWFLALLPACEHDTVLWLHRSGLKASQSVIWST